MSRISDWVYDRAFRIERLNGDGACAVYMYRWTLADLGYFKIYLHHFVADDWSIDFHDHPKRFISIGLKGAYREHTPGLVRDYTAPWIRTFPAEHQHRITMHRDRWNDDPNDKRPRDKLDCPLKDCWTLVIVGKPTRDWGFWHNGVWIYWREYVGDRDLVERVKACP